MAKVAPDASISLKPSKIRRYRNIFVAVVAIFLCIDSNVFLFLYQKIFASKTHLKSAFNGKRVWITGASSGIGTEFAKQLADSGAHLILSSRNETRLMELVENNENLSNTTTTIVPFDMMGSPDDLHVAVNHALQDGNVDILVLNAAIFQERPALLTSLEETRRLMKVNFEGPVELATNLINTDEWEVRGKGHIVVISSRFGKIPGPLSSSYSATKFALHGFFSALNAENPWVRVDFVLPGPVDTNLYKGGVRAKGKKSFYASFPRQMQTPQRVAELVIAGMSGPAFIFYEMWISKPLALFGYYQSQLFPTWARKSHKLFARFAMDCYKYGIKECQSAWRWPKPPKWYDKDL